MNRAKPLAGIFSSPLKTTSITTTTTTTTSLRLATRRAAATTTTTIPTSHPRLFSTTTAKMSSSSSLSADVVLEGIKNRRTYYPLSKDLTITPARVQEIVKEALQHIPSSFNSQSNRVVVLFGAEHEKLWDIAYEVLQGIVPAAQFESTAAKVKMFKASAGTVLFYEDQNVVNAMQEKFAVFADRFPVWAGHSDAMLQLTLWTALEAEGLGANLQHYNPLVDNKVAAEWNIPESWKLSAQLVFGGRTGPAGDKAFAPVDDKFKAFGA